MIGAKCAAVEVEKPWCFDEDAGEQMHLHLVTAYNSLLFRKIRQTGLQTVDALRMMMPNPVGDTHKVSHGYNIICMSPFIAPAFLTFALGVVASAFLHRTGANTRGFGLRCRSRWRAKGVPEVFTFRSGTTSSRRGLFVLTLNEAVERFSGSFSASLNAFPNLGTIDLGLASNVRGCDLTNVNG